MLTPKININGETAESHIAKRLVVIDAMRNTLELMLELRPHGRDYLGDDEHYKRDLDYHNKRFNALWNIKTDIETEAMLIQEKAHA